MPPKLSLLVFVSSATLLAHEGAHTAGNEMPALDAGVTIEHSAEYRTISGDALPDHHHGRFPNPANPNIITPQDDSHRVPMNPKISDRWREVELAAFGIAINGILLEPNAAEWWQDDRNSGWRYEALGHHVDLGVDHNHAHVQPSGKYHYHGMPSGLLENRGSSESFSLIGYAADGFPVYSHWSYADARDASSALQPLSSSYRVKSGKRPDGPGGSFDGTYVQDYEYVEGLGDLDRANGRSGVTPEYPDGTYYYVITPDFPFIPRYWRGEPSRDFVRRGGGGGGGRAQGPPAGGAGRGGRNAPSHPALQALGDTDIIKQLGLTHEESTTLRTALREFQNSQPTNRRRNEDISSDERRAQRQSRLAETNAAVEKFRKDSLTTAQNLRLQQIINRAAGTESLLTDDSRAALQLTDDQFSTLYALIVQARSPDALSFEWSDVVHYLSADQLDLLRDRIGSID
ncbi:MAG: YHYH protein [Opitutaceae bacterium]|jgi:hypothetical protein|nr:YHYH protein [Opitutaceae bacterium]